MKSFNKLDLNDIEISPMTENEINEVLEIQKECGLTPWNEQDYLKEIYRKDSIAKAAKSENGRTIGFVIVRLFINSDNLFDKAEIQNIAVRKNFQRKGIAQKIFDKILNELRDKKISEVWLEVRESNEKAINFYEKNGFRQQSVRKNYYQNPLENACNYSLQISYEN